MPTSLSDASSPIPVDAVVVTADRLAAAQWAAYLATDAVARGVQAWVGPEVLSFRAWAERLWNATRAPDAPMLLSERQSRMLWRRVVAESSYGAELLDSVAVAGLAEDAWRRAVRWRLDLTALGAGREPDTIAFVRWCEDYRSRLRTAGWIDAALLDAALAAAASARRVGRAGHAATPPVSSATPASAMPAPLAPIIWADFEPAPSQQTLAAALAANGTAVMLRSPPRIGGRAVSLRCVDPAEELVIAAEWARERALHAPGARFAIVVPDLAERAAAVERTLRASLAAGRGRAPALHVTAGAVNEPDRHSLLGAALTGVELLTPAAGFAELSRWLRSPYFHAGSGVLASAAVEAALRRDPRAQLPFLDAYRDAGWRRRLASADPSIPARLDAALRELGAPERPRPAGRWARVWTRALAALGFAGWNADTEAAKSAQRRFERALHELAMLTPVAGDLTPARALAELEAGLARADAAARLPLAGIHVLASLADVGPGYAGVWVTGASDRTLPLPVRVNPLLPRRMQAEHGVPWSSPNDALERSRALITRVLERAPEAVLSWPASIRGEPADPSALLANLPSASPGELVGSARHGAPCAAVGSRSSSARRPRETVADPAPPLQAQHIAGGTAALNRQAVCPARAFCEHRLHARPLETAGRGLHPAMRGQILHAALHALYSRFPGHAALAAASDAAHTGSSDAALAGSSDAALVGSSDAALAAASDAALAAAIERAARAAASAAVGSSPRALAVLSELETERVLMLLSAFVRRELERAPFRVDALEHTERVVIAGRTLELRIDRIDLLDAGGFAIIDYKSGEPPRPADWLEARPRDVQLPTYAAAMPSPPAAVAAAVLRPERIAYAGFWEPADAFPGSPQRRDGRALSELVDTWRAALARLVEEYASGDTRIFAAGADMAAGPYAPLTRVHEQLALHRGWLQPWSTP